MKDLTASPLNYKEYRNVDKSDWPRGDWDDEPDKVQWIDEETGFDCLIVRSGSGALCGYVGVPEGHVFHGKGYDEVHDADSELSVHGGLTFSGLCHTHSHETWEAFRGRKTAWEKEAASYPVGDAARRLREWAGTFEDYDAWVTRKQATSICHLPAAGRPDGVWWLGFDCSHSGDVSPAYHRDGRYYDESYKTINYAKREIQNLAKHLAEPNPPTPE